MRITAAVLHERATPFVLEELELDEPRADEILVRIVATGICHTDLSRRDRGAGPFPAVLGHEGAGIVERVGGAVTAVQPGDHVVLTFPSCGRCASCLRGTPAYCERALSYSSSGRRPDGSTTLRAGDEAVHGNFFEQSSFATYALATERNTVKVRPDVPLELLGPLGCGIQTGAGAVLNSLQAQAGSSLAVIGVGSVGLSAIMAAVVAGCTTIIAIDVKPSRLALAGALGATHQVDASEGNVADAIRGIIAAGTDSALDTTGRPEIIYQAVEALAPRGVCGIIGGAPPGTEVRLSYGSMLYGGRSVRGIIEGDSIPKLFIPTLIELYLQGRFPFDRLIAYYPLEQINEAVAASERGEVVKPVLRMETAT